MSVFVAIADTESGDRHTWVFDYEPTKDFIVKCVWDTEGKPEPLQWYRNTTTVKIEEHDVNSQD